MRKLYLYKQKKIKKCVFFLSRLSRLSEEVHPMLNYNSSSDIQRVTYNTADTENNNNNNNVKNGKSPLHKEATVQYSSNAKGVLAQVR